MISLNDQTIERIFDASTNVVDTAEGQNFQCVNESTILTKLIQAVGKNTERWASDLFISWKDVLKAIMVAESDEVNVGYNTLISFFIRKDGVDSNDYAVMRMNEWSNDKEKFRTMLADYYSNIYIVNIEKTDIGILLTLKDVKDVITSDLVFNKSV